MKTIIYIAALGSVLAANFVNADSMYIDSAGRVGIGTNTPGAILHTYAPGATYPVVFLAESFESPNALFRFRTTDGTAPDMDFNKIGSVFRLNIVDGDPWELQLEPSGNLTIKGLLATGSSRTYKDNIVPANSSNILNKLETLQISEWSYSDDEAHARHLGPMAEDFAAVFRLGSDEKHIAPTDMAAVALASVQAISVQLKQKDAEIARLKDLLHAQQAATEARLDEMERLIRTVVHQPKRDLRQANLVK